MNRTQIIKAAQKLITKKKPVEFTMSLGVTEDKRIVFVYSVKRDDIDHAMVDAIERHNNRKVAFYDKL